MTEWGWITLEVALAAHDRALAEYGGSEGVISLGGLEGALGRPINSVAYGDPPDAADLAGLYAVAIAKAHAFVDGNKRTAWTVANGFLWLNGYTLNYDRAEAVQLMLQVADGAVDARAAAVWFRSRLQRR